MFAIWVHVGCVVYALEFVAGEVLFTTLKEKP
jgi:hypothetical protein